MNHHRPYGRHELDMLAPLGGVAFAEGVVKAIRTADAAAYNDCQAIFLDPWHCDVIGDIRRAKINESIAGLAVAMGLDCHYESPDGQRYSNLVIRADDTILTVARMYGRRRVVRPSGFRAELAQPHLDLFGETGMAYVVPDDCLRSLILAYEVGRVGGHPAITGIELHEIGVAPDDVTCRIDLMARANMHLAIPAKDSYDDLDIKPKEGLTRKHA